ncbi:MAG: chloride channel protein, partial [Lachnospiraceae bacterium]|nr:chloride channel protein [Lachnospiraceae bacterium]
MLAWSVLLGILCAALATVMVIALHQAEHLAKRWMKNPYLRVAVCGILFAGLTLLLNTQDYTGAGTNLIDRALASSSDLWDFILKLAFTAIAVAGGFRGGEIVPTLAIGATFGALFGRITGFPVPLGAACGMIALFAGTTNCPIASMLIAMEMFHGDGLPYFAITVSLSFVLSGYYSLYGSQRFSYSKTKAEAIDRKSN